MKVLKKIFYRLQLACLGLRIGKQFNQKLSRKIDMAIFKLDQCGGRRWI